MIVNCTTCGKSCLSDSSFTTGVGYDVANNPYCYACCADRERAVMLATRRAVLYLADKKVTDWPGKLSFQVVVQWTGAHNFGGRVTFVRFIGPDGAVWSVRQVGDFSQLCAVKRTKIDPTKIGY